MISNLEFRTLPSNSSIKLEEEFKKLTYYAHFLKNLLKDVINQENQPKTTEKIEETATSTQVEGAWNT